MADKRERIPEWQRKIDFEGDALTVAMVEGIAYVALRPMVDSLGLDWSGQYRRMMRDTVLSWHIVPLIMCANDRKWRKMIALQLEYVPGWLFGITPSRIKPELEQKLTLYREHCFRVLYTSLQTSFYDVDPSVFPKIYVMPKEEGDAQLDARTAFNYYRRIAQVVYT